MSSVQHAIDYFLFNAVIYFTKTEQKTKEPVHASIFRLAIDGESAFIIWIFRANPRSNKINSILYCQ